MDIPAQKPTVKVAVIGSGLSGLTAAYLLGTSHSAGAVVFEVHLYEKADALGMDSSSVSVRTSTKDIRVDVPMRTFQGGYYPELIRLYKRLGVQFRPTDFSYSFSLLGKVKKECRTVLLYNGSSGVKGVSLPSSSPATSGITKIKALAFFTLSTLQIIFCYIWLLLLACPIFRATHLDGQGVNTQTFESWEAQTMPSSIISRWVGLDNAWVRFTRGVLVPLFSGVCTASEADILSHPVEEFLDYIYQTVFSHHYVATHGVQDVVARLVACVPKSQIHLGAGVASIRPQTDGRISLQTENGTTFAGFDHIIFATQANRAIPILETYLEASTANVPHITTPISQATTQSTQVSSLLTCLRAFQYRRTIVVNHTDDRLMPENVADWRDLNLFSPAASVERLPPGLVEKLRPAETSIQRHEEKLDNDLEPDCCMPPTYTAATHVIDMFSPVSESIPGPKTHIYQTTNPTVAPLAAKVLSVARLERAMLCADAKRALAGLYTAKPAKSTWSRRSSKEGSLQSLGPLQGCGRLQSPVSSGQRLPGIWVCGSYAHAGIPLLEGCVVSARRVVDGIRTSEEL